MKKIPLGLSNFENIRKENYLYIDKTKEIHTLLEMGKYAFFARPRRFGKSLLVQTIKCIFEGKKELFKGLYIYDKIDWEKQPVIHIDYTLAAYSKSKEVFEKSVLEILQKCAREYTITIKQSLPNLFLAELVQTLHRKTGKQVVVLIDEYDKPIINVLSDLEKVAVNREFLRSFYGVLKGLDEYLKFVFLTGVSKFAKVSIFSGLNNVKDITLLPRFNALVGFRQSDFIQFESYLKALEQEENLNRENLLYKIKYWYNGYSWDGKEKLYNPYSLLNLFNDLHFSNHWFSTGTPTFLIDLLKKGNYEPIELENREVTALTLDSYDLKNMILDSLLWQTGYLTVHHKERYYEYDLYTLGYPNQEVKNAFITYILEAFMEHPRSSIQPDAMMLRRSLEQEKMDKFLLILRKFFAKIPSILHLKKEAYYQSLFYMLLTLMGVKMDLEQLTDKGRIDGVLMVGKLIYILEFKYQEKGEMSKLLDKAMTQIEDRKYYESYLGMQKKIVLLGVGFLDKAIDFKYKVVHLPV